MATPYVTPQMIHNAPSGVSWNIIPFPKANNQEQEAEQMNICWRATGIVNAYCNQVLRSTIDNEVQSGPDFRITLEQATGNTRFILQRWPVMQILAIQVTPNTFPRNWRSVPAGYYDIEHPVLGVYGSNTPSAAGEGGQSILIGAGYGINWAMGRNGYRIACSYVNGWPHAGITQTIQAGATTFRVDDVTGFAGAAAFIYDGSQTEYVTVTSVVADNNLVLPNNGGTAPAGPGTVTVSSPTTFEHNSGVIISSLPQDILWATILAATAQALEAGITSVSIQNLPGSMTLGGHGVSDIKTEYEVILEPYRRVI